MTMGDKEALLQQLSEKIKEGESLITRLEPIEYIDGVTKLQRKIRQETQFFKKLLKSEKVKVEHLSCSNLRHLSALAVCSEREGVTAVCKTFHIDDNSKLIVDVISDDGKTWTKVIARNPKSLSALSSGNSSYGARSILDQAQDYVKCAQLYPCMYQPPKVIFEFVSGIEEWLANKLRAIGIVLKGDVLENTTFGDTDWSSESDENDQYEQSDCREGYSNILTELPEITTLNLDVTAMMAYVSNMTNGHCNYVFKQDVLTQQSQWEIERPVKPVLDKLFSDKTLVCCQTAWDEFDKIVNTLGGPSEKQRSAELKSRLAIFPDDFAGEDDLIRSNLKVRGNVRVRSKLIFNFGHRIKALTVSANEGFVRAAKQQGVCYAAFVHESRALTEGKEATATLLTS